MRIALILFAMTLLTLGCQKTSSDGGEAMQSMAPSTVSPNLTPHGNLGATQSTVD